MLVCDSREGLDLPSPLTTHTILVVVRDPQVASAIRQSVEFANPAVHLCIAESGSDALATLQREPVSLAITILPVKTGFEFVAIASERFPALPHVVASCPQADELDDVALRLMDLLEHHEEEMYVDRLAVALVEQLILHRVTSGFLRSISLLDVVRRIESGCCTSTLSLRRPDTNAQAVLFFRGGRLLDVHTSDGGGVAAAREILEWGNVHISLSSGCRDIAPAIDKTVSALMEDWLHQAAQPAPQPLPAPDPEPLAIIEPLPLPPPTVTVKRQPTMRELLASEEVDYAPPAEAAEEPAAPQPEPPQNPTAHRLSETVDYDPSALRQFTVNDAAVPVVHPPPPARSAAELAEDGFVCFRLKDYAGAIRDWEASIAIDATNKNLNYNLKLAYARLAGNTRPGKA
ncbi:MAG: hypothetical protein JST93_25025 [Acidobacteria bacterium]|nr:hypothetical protein [Acidobacteriota bacterium]